LTWVSPLLLVVVPLLRLAPLLLLLLRLLLPLWLPLLLPPC
jgi:hypothetical protein